jgi:N-acetylmuramoyl-L-alanine amidase
VKRSFSFILAAALALPCALSGQTPLRVEAGRAESFAAARGRSFAAYPVTALGLIGATVQALPGGVRVLLFGDTLIFETRSPFFRDGPRARQLFAPPFVDGGTFFLPEQFFIEWLPARYPDQVAYRGGALRLLAADTARAANAPVPAPLPPRVVQRADTVAGTRQTQRVVILDAGHGGRDHGKVGPNGLREKDVALQLAQRIAGLLRDRGYEVHLTRTTDTLIALADRPKLANQWKGGRPSALYVSIHANSGVSSARGFETFFLSDARTEDERRVAEMENAAVVYEDNPPTAGEDLDYILNGLRNDFYIKASNDLAEVVQKRLAMFHPGPNRGVKRAGFRVLVGAFMPAVLVETGFISNPREARLLGTASFQQKVAFGVADALAQFFASHEHLWAAQ